MCARFARSVLLHLVNVGGFGDCIPAGMLAGLVRLVFLWSVPQFSPPPLSEVAFVVRSMLCGYSSEIGYLRSVLGRRSGRRRSAKEEELSAEKQVLSEEE